MSDPIRYAVMSEQLFKYLPEGEILRGQLESLDRRFMELQKETFKLREEWTTAVGLIAERRPDLPAMARALAHNFIMATLDE